ncbi:F-box protein At5g07610-like [Bidens hawaiensis]|uniref:F-box protein At5g07610-like n=1 Tax=Bidens hawaiensis TaxID=980011 RepID=UPI0040490ABC
MGSSDDHSPQPSKRHEIISIGTLKQKKVKHTGDDDDEDYTSAHTLYSVQRRPLIKSFPFNPSPTSGFTEALHSSNGLVLCHVWPDKLYVYNPTVNKYKLLPLPCTWITSRVINGMAIAFDPTVSPHYKTVVYWRDAIHWMDNLEVYHFKCDVENPHFMQVENPKILNGTEYGLHDKLLVSNDRLLLVKMVEVRSMLKMNVYEIKNTCYSGWSIRYHINLECAGDFDLLLRPNLTEPNINLPSGPKYNVLAVVIGKRDEDSFLVLEVTRGKLVQYNVFSKTLCELCDLTPFQLRDTKAGYFLFMLSLAGV